MPSPAHETLAAAFQEDPELLRALLLALELPTPSEPLTIVDSNVRFADPKEVRPDALALVVSTRPSWIAAEVQGDPDPSKARRWPLLAGILLDEHGTMGDLVVVTHSAATAAWAQTVACHRGPLGTEFRLTPVVVELTGANVERLLDPARPELALVAAWAMQDRHGEEARAVVRRALALAASLSEPTRTRQTGAILNVLSEQMREILQEETMDLTKLPEGPLVKLLKTEGKAELLHAQAAMRLGRELSPVESAALDARIQSRGVAAVGGLLLELGADAFAAWLAQSEPQ